MPPERRRELLPQRRACESFELAHGNHRGMFHVNLARYGDGRLAEIFISGGKAGSDVEANVRDTAILVSLALQHGVPIATMAAAITREADGTPSTIIGVVLDQEASKQ